MTTFICADMHLGHRGITQFLRPNREKERPWTDVEEMMTTSSITFKVKLKCLWKIYAYYCYIFHKEIDINKFIVLERQ